MKLYILFVKVGGSSKWSPMRVSGNFSDIENQISFNRVKDASWSHSIHRTDIDPDSGMQTVEVHELYENGEDVLYADMVARQTPSI